MDGPRPADPGGGEKLKKRLTICGLAPTERGRDGHAGPGGVGLGAGGAGGGDGPIGAGDGRGPRLGLGLDRRRADRAGRPRDGSGPAQDGRTGPDGRRDRGRRGRARPARRAPEGGRRPEAGHDEEGRAPGRPQGDGQARRSRPADAGGGAQVGGRAAQRDPGRQGEGVPGRGRPTRWEAGRRGEGLPALLRPAADPPGDVRARRPVRLQGDGRAADDHAPRDCRGGGVCGRRHHRGLHGRRPPERPARRRPRPDGEAHGRPAGRGPPRRPRRPADRRGDGPGGVRLHPAEGRPRTLSPGPEGAGGTAGRAAEQVSLAHGILLAPSDGQHGRSDARRDDRRRGPVRRQGDRPRPAGPPQGRGADDPPGGHRSHHPRDGADPSADAPRRAAVRHPDVLRRLPPPGGLAQPAGRGGRPRQGDGGGDRRGDGQQLQARRPGAGQ